MIPTRAQVKTRFRALLDDPNGARYTNAVFDEAFSEAYDALFSGFVAHQCPRIEIISTYALNPGITSLTPATAGLADFADIDLLEERLNGSQEKYTEVDREDKLSQRSMTDRLLEFVWRFDTFYFVGATTQRDLRITYQSSGTAPTNDNDSINVDGCLPFLSNFSVGVAGQRKGNDEIAGRCMNLAVGPRYMDGVIGGYLWQMIQPRVRSMQNVQIAPRPYGYERRITRRRIPYVAAQQPQGIGGMAPAQFSTQNGTITGAVDGTNATFYLSYPVAAAVIYRSGVRMTQPTDVVFGANVITFQPGQIPQPGDVITADGYL